MGGGGVSKSNLFGPSGLSLVWKYGGEGRTPWAPPLDPPLVRVSVRVWEPSRKWIKLFYKFAGLRFPPSPTLCKSRRRKHVRKRSEKWTSNGLGLYTLLIVFFASLGWNSSIIQAAFVIISSEQQPTKHSVSKLNRREKTSGEQRLPCPSHTSWCSHTQAMGNENQGGQRHTNAPNSHSLSQCYHWTVWSLLGDQNKRLRRKAFSV